jgi:G3E family GTPase
MTRIYLITGFLGSGKTSFLKHVLNGQADKVGVLVNEFGKISIDGPILQQEHMNLVELNNGSIFCSCIKEHFIQSLKDLIELRLEAIFIESSGLADPSNMVQIVNLIRNEVSAPFDYLGSICLIDGLYFEQELKKMVSVERQIKHSQVVLVNKVDLIDTEKLQKIHQKVSEINPVVEIHDMNFGVIDFGRLEFSGRPTSFESTTNKEDNRPYVIVMRLKAAVEKDQILGMVDQIKEHFYRIKGILRIGDSRMTIDTVGDIVDIADYHRIAGEEQVVVFISAIGVTAVSHIVKAANHWIPGKYILES